MAAPYIIYNGVSSEELGVIITRLPDFHRAQRRVSEKTIPGRAGALVQDEGGYDLNTAVLELNCNGAGLREVYGWLRGEGWMISSDEPDYKAYAYIYNGITDKRFRMGSAAGDTFDALSVNLRLEPYLRLATEPMMNFSAAAAFPGQGHDASLPLIRVDGSGSGILMLGGVTAYLTGLAGSLYIDCEAGIAYTLSNGTKVFAGELVELEEGEWPELSPAGATNTLNWTGGITGVAIQPNWRFL